MKHLTPLAFIFIGLLSSCKDTSSNYSVGTGNGNIYSYVYLLDSNSGQEIQPRDFSGIRISIIGGPQSTLTNLDGQFELQSVPTTGAFTMIFTKEGFAEKRDIDHVFNPGSYGSLIEYYSTVKLFQIRRLTPNLVLRPFQSESGADTPYSRAIYTSRIMDSLEHGTYSGYMKIYFGKTESISADIPNSYLFATPQIQAEAEAGVATTPIYRDSLLNNGFSPSDKIYCKAYYTGFYTKNEFYIDKISGKRIYTGLSPFSSEVRNFFLP
jgi:hypothetical protein